MKLIAGSTLLIECSGREIYANGGILGLGEETEDTWMTYENAIPEGYDGDIRCSDWTADERKEVADYMVGLWQRWAKQPDQTSPQPLAEPGFPSEPQQR